MKNLYKFLECKYKQFEYDMSLNEFIENFIEENFLTGALNEALINDEFLFYYKKSYKIDHQNKRIEFLIEEYKF